MSDIRFWVLFANQLGIVALSVAFFLVVRGYLKRASDVLDIAKSYYELGRTQHADAQEVVAKIGQNAAAAPKLAEAVEAMPQKTAIATKDAVIAALSNPDSTILRSPPTDPLSGGQ